jgi:hypothetical protein
MFSLEDFKKGKGSLFVLDVESIGLHGEGFAFGYVVTTIDGPVAQFRAFCDTEYAEGTASDRAWIEKNVPMQHPVCKKPRELRSIFWDRWMHWKDQSVMVADCPFPVEARFLSACVDDSPKDRNWNGPYPLLDVASILWNCGINPLATLARQPEELPAHDPLNDARQSARVLIEAIKKHDDHSSTAS